MNVVREDIDALNSNLKVIVNPIDYEKNVKEKLNKYCKTANIPGFRPGKVPFGMIQKKYGASVLSEELNKIVGQALNKYISDNKIEILGNPIPVEKDGFKGDFDKPEDFEFVYQLGLAPKIKVPLSSKSKFEFIKVKVDDKLISQQIEDLSRRYGKLVSADVVGEKDMILVQFVELDKDNVIKEGGIMHSSTISMEFVKDVKVTKEIVGKKVGDKLIVNPYSVSKGGVDTASMLGIDQSKLEEISENFEITINEIKVMQPAELNNELFDKLFGKGSVKNEEELKKRVKSDLENMFLADSNRLFTKNVYENLIEKTKVKLPDNFLKRWIKLSNEKEISNEQIDADYDNYAKGIKCQIIQGNIFKENDIKFGHEEIIEFTKGLLIKNYSQYGMPAPEDKELLKSAQQVLQNKEEANRIYDMLSEEKLTTFFKETVKLKNKEVSYDDFVKLASDKT